VNVTLSTRQLYPGDHYVLFFRYRNSDLQGTQKVYVSTHGADQRWLETFPDGLGYTCPPSTEWTRQGLGFTVPPDTVMSMIWLRATGQGTAEFADVELRQVP
jgi:hypothetical protein